MITQIAYEHGDCMSVTVATVDILWFDAKRNKTTSTCWNTVTKVLSQERSKVCARLSVLAAITVPSMPCWPCSAATWFLLSTFHRASLLFLAFQDFIVELVTVLKHWDLHSIQECKAAVEFLHQHIYHDAEWECMLEAACMVASRLRATMHAAWSLDAVLRAGALQNRNTGTTADLWITWDPAVKHHFWKCPQEQYFH